MFESFQNRRKSRSGVVAVIVVFLVAAGVMLAVCDRRSEPREREREAVVPELRFEWSGEAQPARLELPGMSLTAPGRAPITGDYLTGGVQHTTAPEWGVTWQRGSIPPREALDRLVEGIARGLETQLLASARVTGSREVTVAGAPGRQYELATDRGYALVVTFAACGGRIVQILAGGPAGAPQLAAKMIASFRCTPDPAQDLTREAVAVEARPGWRLALATSKSMLVDRHEVLVRPTLMPGADGVALEAFVPPAVRTGGFTLDSDRPEELAGRKLWRGSVDGHPAAVLAWRCPGEPRVAAVYIISTRDAPLDGGIELARTGRCLGPGEDPPEYPPVRPGGAPARR